MRVLTLSATGAALLLAAATVPALPGVAAPGAPQAAAAATKCRTTYEIGLTPGLSTQGAPGTSFADDVPVTCNGKVFGTAVSGPGRMVSIAHLSPASTCLGGAGWGALYLRFPTAKGPDKVVVDPITYSFGGLEKGLITGTFAGDRFDGTFTVIPVKGDCVTSPLTRGRLTLTGTLHAFKASEEP